MNLLFHTLRQILELVELDFTHSLLTIYYFFFVVYYLGKKKKDFFFVFFANLQSTKKALLNESLSHNEIKDLFGRVEHALALCYSYK